MNSAHDNICVAMGVPKVLLQMSEATFANAKEARKYMVEDVIIPRSRQYEDTINQDLTELVDNTVRFEFALEDLPILQEDSDKKWARLSDGMDKGLLSEEYVMAEMGYPETAKPKEEIDKSAVAESKMEKKAIKALLRGDSPDVKFETDNISIDRQHLLHGRLSNAKTKDEVRACFR